MAAMIRTAMTGSRTLAILAAMMAALVLMGSTGHVAEAQQYSVGCYASDDGTYYFFYDGGTWYVRIHQLSGMPVGHGSDNAGTDWATWDNYVASHGQPTVASLVTVACEVGYYTFTGYTLYLDGSTWWIWTDQGWMTVDAYLSVVGQSSTDVLQGGTTITIGGGTSSGTGGGLVLTGNPEVDAILIASHNRIIDTILAKPCEYSSNGC